MAGLSRKSLLALRECGERVRTQNRNKTPIWYANFDGMKPITVIDEYGNTLETGESAISYTDPIKLFANVSPARGESASRQFGEFEDYDKVIVFAGKSPVTETSVFWIDNLDGGEIPQIDGANIPHDYIVRKVAQSLNSTSLAVQKVNVSITYIPPEPIAQIIFLDVYGNALLDASNKVLTAR